MKKSELKEIIKLAMLSEMGSDAQYADESAYDFVDEADKTPHDPKDYPENPEDYTKQPGYIHEDGKEEESLDDILARVMGTKADPYMAEAEEEEEDVDVEVDVKDTDLSDDDEEVKSANDSIVVDKKIVSLSSLPGDTRKILDSLETLRAQAEEFGDQKFITQVGNTITFFTRDFVVAGDAPNPAGIEESLVTEDITSSILYGLSPEGLEMIKAAAIKLQTSPEALINGLGMVTGVVGGAAAGIKALTSDKVEDFIYKILGKKKEVKADTIPEGDESADTKMEAELELESLNEIKRIQKLAGIIK